MATLLAGVKREPILAAYLFLVLASVVLAASLSSPLPLVLPVAVLAVYGVLRDLRIALLATIAAITLSTEVKLGSLGTDLPAEPMMWLVTGVGLVFFLFRARSLDGAVLRHPVSLALFAHLAWILVTCVTSTYVLTSVKWLAAKLWYVVPFYFLAAYFFDRPRQQQRLFSWIAVPFAGVLLYCLSRHAVYGFSFAEVNQAMFPFFRGHVNYAALASILLPWFILGGLLAPTGSRLRYGMWFTAFLTLAAVQTSYTRAAYVSLFIGAAFVFVIRWRLTRISLVLATAVLVTIGALLVQENRFFGFAPDYNKTVTHRDFGNLLEATYKLEDISTMERVYRWVAGSYMAGERPIFGFGPGNFYRYYKGYALESFRTYVSDNPEGSGIHSYLLMLLVEQGWIGLGIFVLLCVLGLVTAERTYHNATHRHERLIVLATGASLVINLSFQLINDLIESDKSGPWFFLALALLVAIEVRQRQPRPSGLPIAA